MKLLSRTADPPLVSRGLSIAGVALVIFTVAAAGFVVWGLRQDAVKRARQETQNMDFVLAEQAARLLQAVDRNLQDIQRQLAAAGIENPEQLEQSMKTRKAYQHLARRLRNLPQADSLGIVDVHGRLLSSSELWPLPALDAPDRDYYKYFRDHNDTKPFIGSPTTSVLTGTPIFTLARRISGPHGNFLGVVLAGLAVHHFEALFREVSLEPFGSATIFRRDGLILGRYPRIEAMIGRQVSPESPWYATAAQGGGTYLAPGYVDGIIRIVAVHRVRGFPLFVATATAEVSALADWRWQSLFVAAGALFLAVAFALLFYALAGKSRQLERSEANFRASERRFRDFALISSDWFWETDADHRFTFHSDDVRAFGQNPQSRFGRRRVEIATDAMREPEKWHQHYAVLNSHEPFRDFVYARKVGSEPEHIVLICGNPRFSQLGLFLGYYGTGRILSGKISTPPPAS